MASTGDPSTDRFLERENTVEQDYTVVGQPRSQTNGARARFCNKKKRAIATVAMIICVVLALTNYAGLWNWRYFVTTRRRKPDVMRDCLAVRRGQEIPCGSPWTAPCFNRSRCTGIDSGGNRDRLSIYVHDDSCSMRSTSDIIADEKDEHRLSQSWTRNEESLRRVAGKRGLLAETPEEACILAYTVPSDNECLSRTATWKKGQNHLLVDIRDQNRKSYSSLDVEAMFAEANMLPCYYRQGYDIALPLPPRKKFLDIKSTPSLRRKYFATFKGTLYLSGDGLLERTAVRNLGEPAGSDVVVVELCQTRHNEHLLPRNVDLCERLQKEYVETDYEDLMNTTFALLPGGRSPATYRLGEALSAGAIPVFIHQNFVKPFPDRIPWKDFSFSFPADAAPEILDVLRAVPEEEITKMQAMALEVFDKHFRRGIDGIMETTLDILEDRLSFRT